MNRNRHYSHWLAVPAVMGLMLAGVARGDDSEPDALKKKILELNKVTGEDTVRDRLRDLIKDKATTLKMLKVADDMAKLDSKQLHFNAAYILAIAAGQFKDNDVALRLFRICDKKARELKSSKKLLDAYDGQWRILFESKKFEEAEELSQKLLEEHGDDDLEQAKVFVMEQLIQTKTRQGKVEEALKLTDNLIKLDEGGWYFLQRKGWVLHESGKPEEAAKAYLESIERLKTNERLKPEDQERFIDRTKYILSNVYVDLNQIDKAAANLKDLLKKKPDNSTYNNDLGYIWADHDMNLDEAEKLIRKALDEDRKARKKEKDLAPEDDKDNAAYLDSLGWVLFKKKQFAEAKKHLQEAVKDKEEGQHIEIIDHLADVQMALGQKAEAIKTWKLALEQESKTRRDFKRREEVIKKMKAAEGK
jgi:tetratricopeptide (TPR) repeat protein